MARSSAFHPPLALPDRAFRGWLLFLLVFLAGETAWASPAISVVFRNDDYSATTDWDAERRIIEIFQERGLSLTVAAVPFSEHHTLAGERAHYLRDAVQRGTVEPALHGCVHVNASHPDTPTEFRGIPEKDQRENLERCLRHLEQVVGRDVEVFVPPWNSYDNGTERALSALGIRILSSSYDGPVLDGSSLSYLPYTALLHEVREAVAAAREQARQGQASAVVVLTHAYEFTDGEPHRGWMYGAEQSFTFDELAELLDWLRAQPDVAVTTFADLEQRSQSGAAPFASLVAVSGQYADLIRLRGKITPPWLARPVPDPLRVRLVYPPTLGAALSAGQLVRLFGLSFCYYLVVLLAGAGAGLALGRLSRHWELDPRIVPVLLVGSAVGLAATLALAVYHAGSGYRVLAGLVLLSALPGGVALGLRRRRPASENAGSTSPRSAAPSAPFLSRLLNRAGAGATLGKR